MNSREVRQKYLDFFKKNGHKIIPSAPLVPSDEEQLEGKEKVLFTTAGMQPLIPYLFGKPHPEGKRLANCQKCLRTDDIEEVGDNIHHTFFEMLGNWSLGDYWKKEAIKLSFEFLTEELEIPIEKLAVSVFAGDEDAPKDEESAKAWKDLGIPEERIAYLGKEDNWWPTNPAAIGPCGADTEMFYWTGEGMPESRPETDSRWVEIWNDVFMEFNRKDDGSLEKLSQRNVDTGMGFERTVAVLNGKKSAYETDLFLPIIDKIKKSKNNYSIKSQRIIADHLRAAVFLIAAGVKPDPKDSRGSVVHRLITLSLYQENKQLEKEILDLIIGAVIGIYQDIYTELRERSSSIYQEIQNVGGALYRLVTGPTYDKFNDKLQLDYKGPNAVMNASATISFYTQSMGIPMPVAIGTAQNIGYNMPELLPYLEEKKNEHRERSKGVAAGVFKGGLAGHSETEIKYHTATHLLHQALRDVLGPEVFQKGSNINEERLRFDFSFDKKMTEEEIKKTEEIINERIKQNLKVDRHFMSVEEAQKMNAIGLFTGKYEDTVSIYAIGPNYTLDPNSLDPRLRGGYYSVEFCGGPHVEHTSVIGGIKITKEEAISAGVRRIYAELS